MPFPTYSQPYAQPYSHPNLLMFSIYYLFLTYSAHIRRGGTYQEHIINGAFYTCARKVGNRPNFKNFNGLGWE